MKHSSLFTLAVMAAAYLVVASPSDAASMTWGTPTTVTNVLDIDVSGDAVHAGSWGTTGNLDVNVDGTNTVIFEDRPINTSDDEAGVTSNNEQGLNGNYYSGDTGSTNFNAVMDSNAGGQTKVLTLKKLIPGATYQVQLFLSDERSAEGPRTQKWSDNAVDGAGSESAAVQRNQAPSVIGTFVADATSIVIYGLPISHADTILSAYVLRKTADAATGVFFDPPSGAAAEGGGAGSYELQTTTVPASNLTVSVTAPADVEVSLDRTTFSSNVAAVLDGVTPDTVYYRAVDDGSLEATEMLDITHAIASGDGGSYPTSLAIGPYTVTVTDAPTPNIGDMAIYNNAGATPVQITDENGATPSISNEFTTIVVAPMSGYALDGDGKGIVLSAGRHLVLYNNRIDQVSGSNRAEMQTHLTLESGGSTTALAYGRAQGFIRGETGADETVISGGTILVAGTNDILRLITTRTDVNNGRLVQVEPGHTAVQLLKLDDGLDYLRALLTINTPAATSTAFAPVPYTAVEQNSPGVLNLAAGTADVTLGQAGHYLVLANTHLRRINDNATRTGYTQQLALDGTAIEGSKTTVYLRGSQNGEQANDGALAIGMIVEAAAGQVLRVEQSREGAQSANIMGGMTALAIVKLPTGGAFIRLEDTSGQNINPGANNGDTSISEPMTFGIQTGTVAAVFSHTVSNSQVAVNADGGYLFLGGFFCDDDTADRQVPNQQWSVNGTTQGYGESSRYSRNQNVQNNGNWSGVLADLSAGDIVEMTSRRLAGGTAMPGHSMGLQGAAIASLTTNPVLLLNEPLPVAAGTTETITSNELLTADSDDAAADLTYTVDSVPTGGTLRNGVTALGLNDTFTQADINNGDINFVGGAATGGSFGFAFSVSDGGGNPAQAFFTVKIATPIILAGDAGTTDEDTLLTALTGGIATVLDNDTGDTLSVTAFDAVSANGATVLVNANGTFSYDPDPATALQQLGGGSLGDTFGYTVTDAIGKMATATVTVNVAGIEDTFAAVDNYVDDPVNRIWENAGASITTNLALNDGIVRTANGTTNDILLLNYDAAGSAGMGAWENLGSAGGATMNWILGPGVTLNAVTSARGGISAAYSWDGSTDATAGLSSGGGDSPSEILGTGLDLSSASIELWVKPSAEDLTQNTCLFETGGGTGTGIMIDSNGVLRVANAIQVSQIAYDLVADSQGLLGGGATAEFFQVLMVMDLGKDLSSLYVNGTLVGTAANTITDWDGGDGAGLGHFRGSAHGGFQNTAAGTVYDTYYHGSMAACRIYSEALSPAEVYQNFQAIDQGRTDMEGDVLSAWGIYDANTNLVGGTGTPVTLPSGGVVTLDSQFTDFTYSPVGIAGISDHVAGEILTDSFDILVSGVVGPSDVSTVTVAIHGLNQASNDTLAATELMATTFTAAELVGNDQHTLSAGRPLVDLNAGDVTATNIALGIWPNMGTAGATYDATVNGGTLVDGVSGFGAIGTAWENPAATLASFDPVSAADASFEVWFKPSFGSIGKQVLFECGGNGNGSSIAYDAGNNQVIFTADCGADTDANTQLRVDATGISYDEFNQVVVVYDRDKPGTTDSLTLYVNNDPTAAFDATPTGVATNAAGANDWAGTDGGGIGVLSNTAARNETLGQFVGQIAMMRVYTRALSVAEIEAIFDATVQPIQSVTPASPIQTTLGGAVTLNADGSVTYDASSLSTNIPAGEVRQDSFTYTIDDGVGGIAVGTVTVNVTGIGTFYAVDDADMVSEDGPALTFDPRTNDVGATGATIELETVVAGYRADYQDGVTQGDLADFSATTGWRYMWNADGDDSNLNGPPAKYLRLTALAGHPGRGSGQNEGISNNLDRAVIAAFTVSETGYYGISDSFLLKIAAGQTIQAVVYVEDTHIGTVTSPGGVASSFDMELGQVNAGETIYVGAAPDVQDGSDSFEWDFSIAELPHADSELLNTLGTVTTDGTNITYDPNGQFETLPVGQSVFETFAYTVNDGSNVAVASVTVQIDGANDAPVGVADANAGTTDQDTVLAGGASVLANDTDIDQGEAGFGVAEVEGDTGNVGAAVALASGATVTMAADGTFDYDPNGQFEALGLGETGTDTFTYLVEDTHGLDAMAVATVTVTVAGLDDGVIATSNDYAVPAEATVNGNVIADDTGDGVDVSIDASDTLSILSVDTNGLQGLLTIGTAEFMGTRGTISNLTDAVQTVTFDTAGGRFSDPVVFANPPSHNEAEPAIVLISNVTATTFDIWLKEQPEGGPAGGTNDLDGATHAAESVSWFALEAGQYQLANGALLEVATVDTAAIRHDGAGGESWQTVNFSGTFTTAPVVFNQIQTFSGTAAEKAELFGTRMSNPATTASFQVALEDYEGDTAARSTPETIGWMAIEPGVGTWNGMPFEAGITGDNVDEVWYTVNFARDYGTVPDFISSQATIAGVDPTQLRHRNLDNDSVQILGSEDTYLQTEVAHALEKVTYLAIGGTGDLTAYPAGTTQGEFTYDPNGAFGGLSLGQTAADTFTYTLTDGHGNTDTKTVTITVNGGAGTLLIVR